MKRPQPRRALVAVLLAAHLLPAAAQGIPVIDMANLTQAIQQLLAWEQQWLQMQQQLQQQWQQIQAATRHLESTIGTRGLGTIENQLREPTVAAGFPAHLAAATSHAEAARLVDVQARRVSDSTAQRFRQIQALMERINQTTDAKGIQELHSRIGAEQAMIAAEHKELEQLQQWLQARQAAIDRAGIERDIKALSQPLRLPASVAP